MVQTPFEKYENSDEWDVIKDVPFHPPVRKVVRLLQAVAEDSHVQYQYRDGWKQTRYADVAFKNLHKGDGTEED